MLYGYCGKFLDVDLSSGKVITKSLDERFARDFVGGMGFSCKILYDEVGPDVDPLGPDNVIIYAAGPLTGTQAPCASRTEVTTKSPLTGSLGSGNTGGVWGAILKHAGLDMIIVRNKAEKPVYLWIDDDKVEIREASHLWGKDTRVTSDILREELGASPNSLVSVLAIGPAGENLVRYACVLNDYHHVAARCGAGAVMGAKRLKAIVVRGTGTIKIARPEEFRQAAREARERMLACNLELKKPGSPGDPRVQDFEEGCLPGKNFQTGVLPQWIETRSLEAAKKYPVKKDSTCYACPIPCFNLVEVKEGKYAGLTVNRALMPGVVLAWGAKCAIDNIPAIWKCKETCQSLGMDYESTCGTIAFATELFQRGILTKSDTDGMELSWGNEDAVIRLLHDIAYREGLGDILAEGSVRAAAIIGKGAAQYTMTIKGMEMAMLPDPRSAKSRKGWLFDSLTSPRGGDNIKGTHFVADQYNPNWWIDKFDIFEDAKAKMYNMPPEEVSRTWEGKALMCCWFEDLNSFVSAAGLCFFPFNHMALGPTYLARLYSACTGWDSTPQDIMKMGEKVFTLLKSYIARQGMTRKDDIWPERFFKEPLSEGPARGAILSRDTVDRLLDEYYGLRGWDKKSGLPTEKRLKEIGLQDIAKELKALGKISA